MSTALWTCYQITCKDESYESTACTQLHLGRVANPRPVAKIKTGHVSQPITDAADATGRDRSWIATRPWSTKPVEATGGVLPVHPDGHGHEPSREIWAHSASACIQHGDEHRITNSGEEQLKQLDILEISRLVCTSIRHLPSRWNWKKKTAGSRWTYFDSRVPRNWTIRS